MLYPITSVILRFYTSLVFINICNCLLFWYFQSIKILVLVIFCAFVIFYILQKNL